MIDKGGIVYDYFLAGNEKDYLSGLIKQIRIILAFLN
jgi:hypothetical protein